MTPVLERLRARLERRPVGHAVGRHVAVVGAMLVVVTVLHMYTDPSFEVLQHYYRRLYYVPVAYAAFQFGLRGGLITAIAASALLVPTALHAPVQGAGPFGVHEMVVYFALAVLVGWLRDAETRRTEDLWKLRERLEGAYGQLEERAVQLINVQEYTQSILQSITSGVITVGPDRSVATANAAAERIIGLTEDEMVPHPLPLLFRRDGGLDEEVGKVLRGRVARTLRDLTVETQNGRAVDARVTVSRMSDVDGRVLGAVVTLEDISEVKSLTAQLMRADRLAAMGELTAGVAHEVRNPLGIIRATAQLLEEENVDASRAAEACRIINQEIDRLDGVVKALLDFGRPSRPALVEVDVEELLESVVLLTKKWASASQVGLEVSHAGELPSIMADPNQIKQVFVNLISNGVQVMGEGGRLRIETGVWGDFVRVSFADDGPGIPLEDLRRVFDPFFSTKDEGTGLGLTIVHRIVDEHDGHIEVESTPGRGTTFTVYLPVHARMEGSAGPGAAEDPTRREP